MPNTSVRAAAEGLPEINRRRVLFGLAASTAIVAPVAVAAASPVSENTELMRLDEVFRAVHADYLVAHERKQAARARYDAIAPALPPELVHRGTVGGGLTEQETDCEGNIVWPADLKKPARRIYCSDAIYRFHGRDFDAPQTKSTAHWRVIYAIAKQYEEAVAAAIQASGIYPAMHERSLAVDDVRRVFWKIAEQEARTVAGLMAKANALACFAAIGPQEAYSAKATMGKGLADDILAVFGSAS